MPAMKPATRYPWSFTRLARTVNARAVSSLSRIATSSRALARGEGPGLVLVLADRDEHPSESAPADVAGDEHRHDEQRQREVVVAVAGVERTWQRPAGGLAWVQTRGRDP